MFHAEAIQKNHDVLLRCTTINLYVIDFLRAKDILDEAQESDLKAERSHQRQRILLFQWLKVFPSHKYESFLQVMKDAEQEHVANLLTGSIEDDHLPLSDARYRRLVEIRHKMANVTRIDNEVIAELRRSKTISMTDVDEIRTVTFDYAKISKLISAIMRRSNYSYNSFQEVLRKTKQMHVAQFLDEGEMPAVHLNNNRPDLDGPLSIAFDDVIRNKKIDDAEINDLVAEMNGFSLDLVKAAPGQSIVIFIYCKTIHNAVKFTQLFNSGRLLFILESIFNRLLLTVEPHVKKLDSRISLGDEDVINLEEFTGIEGWMTESLHRQKLFGKKYSRDATTQTVEESFLKKSTGWMRESPDRPNPFVKLCGRDATTQTAEQSSKKKFTGWMRKSFFRPKHLDKICGCDVTTQTDEELFVKQTTKWLQIKPTEERPDEQDLYSSAYADGSRERKLRDIIEYTYELFPSAQADEVMEHIYENIGEDLFLALMNLKVEQERFEGSKEKQEPRYIRTLENFYAVQKRRLQKPSFQLPSEEDEEEEIEPYYIHQCETIEQKQLEPIGYDLPDKCQSSQCQTVYTKSTERKIAIRGLTILGKELFIVTEERSEVEVFHLITLSLNRRCSVQELTYPRDIGSCSRNNCLYIIDFKPIRQWTEILRVDPIGKLIKKWSTGNDTGWGLSVTHDSNVILAVFEKHKLNEYSSNGKLIREINLSLDADICHPWHAIKIGNGHFVVSHGRYEGELHRVCLVDGHGKLKKSFGGECGSTIEQMNSPVYLSVDESGFVMVADQLNSRILLLDSDLQFKREILSNENHGLQNPWRIFLDESNGRLFGADNNWDSNVEIFVFQL